MSSMPAQLPRPARFSRSAAFIALAAALGAGFAAPAAAQIQYVQRADPGQQAAANQAIDQWQYLTATRGLSFAQYANFAVSYPDFPKMETIRLRAEAALATESQDTAALIQYFRIQPPLTNPGRAAYALALTAQQRPEAADMARAAWRGGEMSAGDEAYLLNLYGAQFAAEDHAARVDALLWQGEADAALRMIAYLPQTEQDIALARIALLRGSRPGDAGLSVPNAANFDAGYTFTLVNYLRARGQTDAAIQVLANRPQFNGPAFNPQAMVEDMLALASAANATDTVRIASRIDDLFAPRTDVSQGSFKLRDQYTDLMWKGGTNALWRLGDGVTAAPLFLRYGLAARTPITRSKGFYWAARAAQQAGRSADANRYFEMAAQYPHYYYGQLAITALGRAMPQFAALPQPPADPAIRAEFERRPLTLAIRALASNRRDWRIEREFFEAMGDAADTPQELALASELARQTGLNEMAVVLGFKAEENGLAGFERVGFPTVETPYVNDWTMVHAISRQESEFDRTRQSHAGARGMMQLIPSTAREQAGKLGLAYDPSALFSDPGYNITLGDAFFARMVDYYDGSYPLAVAAYNAGPGNVNKWLRSQGDPRRGEVDWQTWIERIEFTETRYYVMRVLGNAVSYSHMYPEQAGTPRTIDRFF
jgi:soluble lytic murein transglycosylase